MGTIFCGKILSTIEDKNTQTLLKMAEVLAGYIFMSCIHQYDACVFGGCIRTHVYDVHSAWRYNL